MRFSKILDRLYTEKHTGPVLLHFAGGIPRKAEILAPSMRIDLDTEPTHRGDLTADCTLAASRSADASAKH